MSGWRDVGGTLFPEAYLRDGVLSDADWSAGAAAERDRARLVRWWARVTERCGPASGLRSVFDEVAMPLFGMLGFRAREARFEPRHASAVLEARGSASVGLVLFPWAERPSVMWRELAGLAREAGSRWCFLLAPPFLSLVHARGHASRRSVDFNLPGVLTPEGWPLFATLASAAAFGPTGDQAPPVSGIERLLDAAARHQDRVSADLQNGVIAALGALVAVLHAPAPQPRFDEALTLVYRILFLLFAESREAVPLRDPIYGGAYAVGALCREAAVRDPCPGLWEGLAAITRLSRRGCRTTDLIVSPFNGRLFARAAAPSLEGSRRSHKASRAAVARDRAMRDALVALGSRRATTGRQGITYRDLGVEELGAVYERVLDLEPGLFGAAKDAETATRNGGVRARTAHGERRKETGTFYTPRPLAEFVVRRALAPLVAGRSTDGILALRVLDPAMGSGAFLVAACRYLAAAYERALVDEGRAAPADLDEDRRADIRRLVAERCLSGVDRNPVAVQLARLSLWLTTLARGRPLGFLDHRLRVGNSLVGASPDDLTRLPGRHRRSSGELPLFEADGLTGALRGVVRPLGELRCRAEESVADVRAKERIWQRLSSRASPIHAWRVAGSLWCARWFWPDSARVPAPSPPETRALIDGLVKADRTLPAAQIAAWLREVETAEIAHGFFHWTLEFADVFYDETGAPRASSGFDAVLGNPPWEMLRRDGIAGDPHPRSPAPHGRLVRFIRESGLYPSCDRGHVNLYQPFLERALSLCRRGGQVGLVLPWGAAADDGASALRRRLLQDGGLHTLVGLDNGRGLFPIHRGLRFLVTVGSPGASPEAIRGRFGVRSAEELDALPGLAGPAEAGAYPVRLTPRAVARVGGAALRFPDIRHPHDLALVERLMDRFPPLGSPAGWHAEFGRELNATDDRASFGPTGLPVIAGRHLQPFRVSVAGAVGRIERIEATRLLPDRRFDRPRVGYRDVSGVANRRTLIAAVVPAGVVTTHTVYCLKAPAGPDALHFLCGVLNSYVMNAIVRMLMAGHLTTTLVEGLPVPEFGSGRRDERIAWLARRLAERPSAAWAACLEAEVAWRYGLEEMEFRRLLEGFPLVPRADRERAVRALVRRVKRARGAPAPE